MPRIANLFRALALPAVLVGVLEWYMRGAGASSDALAPPTMALLAFGSALKDGSLWRATLFTLGSAAAGLGIGTVLGLLLGIFFGLSPRAARMSFLSVEVLRPVPSVALIPLALLVYGFGMRMEVSVVAFATFWPMLVLSQAAARQVEPRLVEVASALGLSKGDLVRKIVIPAMVPRLFVALRLGVAIALVVAVTVEIAANPNGMGYAIMNAQQSLDPALMLAWLFWIGAVGFFINAATLSLQIRVARRMGGAL